MVRSSEWSCVAPTNTCQRLCTLSTQLNTDRRPYHSTGWRSCNFALHIQLKQFTYTYTHIYISISCIYIIDAWWWSLIRYRQCVVVWCCVRTWLWLASSSLPWSLQQFPPAVVGVVRGFWPACAACEPESLELLQQPKRMNDSNDWMNEWMNEWMNGWNFTCCYRRCLRCSIAARSSRLDRWSVRSCRWLMNRRQRRRRRRRRRRRWWRRRRCNWIVVDRWKKMFTRGKYRGWSVETVGWIAVQMAIARQHADETNKRIKLSLWTWIIDVY